MSGSGFKCKAHLTSAVAFPPLERSPLLPPDFINSLIHSHVPCKMPLENQGLPTCQLLTQIAPYQRGIEVHNTITRRTIFCCQSQYFTSATVSAVRDRALSVSTGLTLVPPRGFSCLPPAPFSNHRIQQAHRAYFIYHRNRYVQDMQMFCMAED